MKSNPSPSAPLNLCAPVGVTGTALPAFPVKDTPSYKGKAAREYKAGKENGAAQAAESPKSILTLDNERKAAIGIKNESELVRAYWEGWLEGWNGGHAPASPVDSVGKPADFSTLTSIFDKAELEGLRASHAAKDAKIKALEEACNLLIREMQFTGKIREDFSRRVAVEAGKKALALPSA